MLSIILPPIVIALGIALLVWLFIRKRKMLFLQGDKEGSRSQEIKKTKQKKVLLKDKKKEGKKGSQWMSRGFHVFQKMIGFEEIVPKAALAKKKKEVVNLVSRSLEKHKIKERSGAIFRDVQKKTGMARPPKMQQDDTVAVSENTKPVEDKGQYENILIERIALNPRDIEAYERLGDYYIERKEYSDAKECYKQVLKLSPVNRKARTCMRKLEKLLHR